MKTKIPRATDGRANKAGSLHNILLQGEKILENRGVDGAASYFRAQARKRKAKLSHLDLLERLARSIQLRDPSLALRVVEQVLQEDEDRISAWTMANGLYDRLGQRKSAREAGLRVANSDQADPGEVLQVANLLVRLGEDQVALDRAQQAFEELGRPLSWVPSIQYIAQRTSAWELNRSLVSQVMEAYSAGREAELNETPRTHILWCEDELRNIRVIQNWSDKKLAIPGGAKPMPVPRALEGRKIRVGYLSSDFREHPTSRLINGLLRNHDRSRFEVILYCSGWDDGSKMRKEVESHADRVCPVADLSDKDAADLIRSHEIDVLVELNGPTRANRMGVLAHRPAPVQIDYLGWPGSVGGRVVDYIVGDYYTVPPGAELHYPEKVIRLRDTYQVNDYAATPLPQRPLREDYRLPPDMLVIGMFNAINKVDENVWGTWMRILKAVPNAVLWILDPGQVARKNLSRFTRNAGVAVKRVIAAPMTSQQRHLARLQCCDIMVDPWPYGGHTSTSDALFSGVPVVSLEGKNFPGRVSGGLLRAAGLGALVQPDVDAYVNKAVELLSNPDKIDRIKRHLLDRRTELGVFNASSRARELEAAYQLALRLRVQGKEPNHISIGKPPAGSEKYAAISPLVRNEENPAARPDQKCPLLLVCGPWSSGTSAVTGVLANAGAWAPGPYLKVNDPKTSQTFEMKVFRDIMLEIASEQSLQLLKEPVEINSLLSRFRDSILKNARSRDGVAHDTPVLLKHALTALILPHLYEVFDLRIIVVLRDYEDIEKTRQRRKWHTSFGMAGARAIYPKILEFLAGSSVPFRLVRYDDFLAAPEREIRQLMEFCSLSASASALEKARSFLRT